jgi:endonuclease YncB( thermonuclease family)
MFSYISKRLFHKSMPGSEDLRTINPDDVPYFTFDGKIIEAIPCNIYDGDTFSIVFAYRGEIIKYRCRCLGYDTPEIKPRLNAPDREKEIEAAKAAKARFCELLLKNPDKLIRVQSAGFDKYGRILVNVWNMVDQDTINDIMIREGHAHKYSGGTKEIW